MTSRTITYSNPHAFTQMQVGKPFSSGVPTVEPSGSFRPTLWGIYPSLPAGLHLDQATGEISGTPRERHAKAAAVTAAVPNGAAAHVNIAIAVARSAPGAPPPTPGWPVPPFTPTPGAGPTLAPQPAPTLPPLTPPTTSAASSAATGWLSTDRIALFCLVLIVLVALGLIVTVLVHRLRRRRPPATATIAVQTGVLNEGAPQWPVPRPRWPGFHRRGGAPPAQMWSIS